MSRKFFIINGNGGVGKSSFIKCCQQIRPDVIELSMVDFVKDVATYVGWKGEKTEKARIFLCGLKDVIENYDHSITYNALDTDISLISSNRDNPIFFINARSPEDIQYLVDKYQAVTVLVTNPKIPRITSNHADSEVNNYKYDYTIVNSGNLQDLSALASLFLQENNCI